MRRAPWHCSVNSAVRKPMCLKRLSFVRYTRKCAKDFYDAFRLKSPDAVRRTEIGLVYEFDDGDSSRLTRNLAFARRPVIADEIIEARRKKKNAPETVPEAGKRPSERFEKQEDYGTRSGRSKPAGKEKKTQASDTL